MNRQKSKKQEKSPIGKPRSSWPVIEGIAACAAQIGAPEALLKSVKKAGCKAFLTGNRVDTGILLPALFATLSQKSKLPEGIATPQDWLATEKAKREQIKRQNDEKETMPTADAKTQAAEAQTADYAEDFRMANEFPPSLAGHDAVTIHKRLLGWVKAKWKNVAAKYEAIGE